jgi:glc operon protein GlcG
MLSWRKTLLAALLPILAQVLSAQIVNQPSVGLELAKKIAARAEAEAAKNQWTVYIVVVDDGANLVFLERMDGTQLGSLEVALGKAKTALKFKRPTKVFQDRVNGGGNDSVLSIPGVVAIDGGLPLMANGVLVGAIGVSGMKPEQDAVVAQAGASVMAAP